MEKRLVVSILATVAGALGIAVSIAAIIAVWWWRPRLDRAVVDTMQPIETALTQIEERAHETNSRVQGMRDALHELNHRVQQVIADRRGESITQAPDIAQLERQLYARFQQGRSWIQVMLSSAELVDQLMQIAKSTSTFLQEESRTAADLAKAVLLGKRELQQALSLFEDVRIELDELRANQDVDENAKQLQSLYTRIDGLLDKLANYGSDFESGVVQTQADATNFASRLRNRILWAAALCTVLLLWTFAGQVSLFLHGKRALQAHRANTLLERGESSAP